ncbi:MAG: hypothetical protein IPP31_12175 [Chitinophagaceae bacterium]|nr:hypothetical protein [Chitinophagaceae bacterium]
MNRIKPALALGFLLVYTFSATATREWLKLPVLAEHYRHHQTENEKINLVRFLVMHYAWETGSDQDAGEDNRLPFNSDEMLVSLLFISITPPSAIIFKKPAADNPGNSYSIPAGEQLPDNFAQGIWQPPRNG